MSVAVEQMTSSKVERPQREGGSSVTFKDVAKSFAPAPGQAQGVMAVSAINEEIKPGEFIVILGPSGCGKSTLLSMVAGLELPTAGEIQFAGEPISGPRPGLSMVFQEDALFPWRTALGNVEFGLESIRVPKIERRARAQAALELVGLSAFAMHFPRQLSGGMRQRVSIARALAVDPDVLLMDEPFGALDQQNRYYLGMELLRIWEETRKTVIFVTHDISEAVLLADRVWLMTPRPGAIDKDLTIDLPRPRGLETMSDPRFHELTDELWDALSGQPGGPGDKSKLP